MIATTMRTLVRSLPLTRIATCISLVLGAMLAVPTTASAAVSASVRNACMSDYFAYCAGLEVGSKELRRCMNRAGPKLTPACVSALVAAGEESVVPKARVKRRTAALAG